MYNKKKITIIKYVDFHFVSLKNDKIVFLFKQPVQVLFRSR